MEAPYDPVVPESQSAPPPDGYHRLPHAVVDGPGDSYVQDPFPDPNRANLQQARI